MSLYIIAITPEMKKEAKKYEDAILKTLTLNRKANPTALNEDRRYYTGFMGELVFAEALRREGKDFGHNVNTEGLPETYKFKVIKHETEQAVRLNICTASKAAHKYLAVPETKFGLALCDGYIGIRIMENDYAQICGYIARKDLYNLGASNFPGGSIPAYRCALENLKPIEKLFEQLKNSEKKQ